MTTYWRGERPDCPHPNCKYMQDKPIEEFVGPDAGLIYVNYCQKCHNILRVMQYKLNRRKFEVT